MLINLKVKTLDARTHEFKDINNEITVRAFKDQIAEKTGISPDQQRIIYCGRVLADEKPLKDFDVDGKVLHVAERPPPSQQTPTTAVGSGSNDAPRPDRTNRFSMRNSPLFRALDGMVLGTMAIPMNGGNVNAPTALHSLSASSSFCMNRITVARHMLNCVDNIAAYLEDPSRGLNNVPLDILARGRWTMESTVVEVGITATDIPQSQNIVDMVQGAVSAALRRNGNTNVTVVQLPAMFSSSDSDAIGAVAAVADMGTQGLSGGVGGGGGSIGLELQSDNPNDVIGGGVGVGVGGAGNADNDMTLEHVIIEDLLQDIDDAMTNASSNVAQMGSAASSDSGSTHSNQSNSTSTTDGGGGIGSTSVGTNTEDSLQSRRTGTNVLAEVLELMRNEWTRMSPFIAQTQEMLRNEPTFDENDTAARENAQRLFDRVSEAFHYMSHAQHAISDLMLDYNQATPRFLTCRPILVEQSGYVSSNNYISAAAAAAAANAFRQSQNPMQQQPTNLQQQQAAPSTTNDTDGSMPPADDSNRARTSAAVVNERGSDSNSIIVDDPVDEPISASGPNRMNGSASTATSNAGTQSTGDNHQLQMARLIEAVVNSAPADSELHVQINPPSVISVGVPPPRRRRPATVTAAPAASPAAAPAATAAAALPATTGTTNDEPTTTNDGASNENDATTSPPSSPLWTTPAAVAASLPSFPTMAAAVEALASAATFFNQARVNTATLPTTSTQTRSTPRPQIHFGTLPGGAVLTGSLDGFASVNNDGAGSTAAGSGVVGNGGADNGGGGPAAAGRMHVAPQSPAFDRFLPCNSHHIREVAQNAAASNSESAAGNGRQAQNSATTPAVNGRMPYVRLPSRSRFSSNMAHFPPIPIVPRMHDNSAENSGFNAETGNASHRSASISNNAQNLNRSRNLPNLICRPSLTVGGTAIITPRANAAPYMRRPAGSGGGAAAAAAANVNTGNTTTSGNCISTTISAAPPSASIAAAASSSSTTTTSTPMSDDSNDATSSSSTTTTTTLSSPALPPTAFNDFSTLRIQLNEFLHQTLFGGRPVNATNMEYARDRAIDWFAEHLYYLRQYEKPEYDSHKSVLNILRQMWPKIVESLNDSQTDTKLYGNRLADICQQMMQRLYSVLIVCIGRENADIYWVQLMQHLTDPIKLRFRAPAVTFLRLFINVNLPQKSDINDAGQFVICRDGGGGGAASVAAEPIGIDEDMEHEVEILPHGARIGAGDNDNGSPDEKPTGSKPTTSATTTVDGVLNDLQQQQQLDTEMLDLESNSSKEQHPGDDLSDDAAARFVDAATSLAQVLPTVELPTNVNIGAETWHNTVPHAWIPLLTRDMQFQSQNPPTQMPYSDGYIVGMSAKRRKIIQNSKAQTAGLRNLIASSAHDAIVATIQQPVNNLPSSSSSGMMNSSNNRSSNSTNDATPAAPNVGGVDSEAVIDAIVGDANVQAACKNVTRTSMRERFKTDTDYEPERLPQATKFSGDL